MSKDILSETFQKHLKLLHKHLNINEAYGDPAYLDFAMRDRGQRREDDPDGYTGIRQPSSYRPARNYDPEERAREEFSKTVAGYARDYLHNDYNGFVRYLNQIKYQDKNNWKTTDIFEPNPRTDSYAKFDKDAFKRWAERDKEEHERDYKNRTEKEKQEAPSREIESKAFEITRAMTMIIQSIGLVKWQLFKLKNPEEKLKYLSDYFEKNKDKLTKGHFDREKYEDIKPYFDKYSNYDQQAKLILLAAIKKSEKSSGGRGFFEQ